jgi:hypothetical protein
VQASATAAKTLFPFVRMPQRSAWFQEGDCTLARLS